MRFDHCLYAASRSGCHDRQVTMSGMGAKQLTSHGGCRAGERRPFSQPGTCHRHTRRARLKFAKLDIAEKEHMGMPFGRTRCRE